MSDFIKRHRKILVYIFWGCATTGVDYGVYFLLTQLFGLNYLASNIVAWFACVVFAFWSNKQFVFQSRSWKMQLVLMEFVTFTSGRLLSGLMETGLLWAGVVLGGYPDGIVKIAAGAMVMVVNYLHSQFFVFRKVES